jgi:hypothetical protein
MEIEDIIIRVSKIEVLHKNDPVNSVSIELRNPEKNTWAVKTLGGLCINKELLGDYEPMPSNRTDEWLKEFRFDEKEAHRIAVAYLVKVTEEREERELKIKNRKATGAPRIQ